jgi:amino acid adenylation domain-containing protein/non-ribosomal peptide synthase protein (TIGR01720 family)
VETSIIDIYELSPMQQGMLFHTLYAPNSGMYFEQRCCVIRGNLNLKAFYKAWQCVVDRHSVFKTAFHWQELEKPLQVVYNYVDLPWQELDWRHLSVSEQEVQLNAFLAQDRALGFDLQQPPLMRCTVISLEPGVYQFIWSHHHLLMDGWCNGLLLKEVFTLYKAFCQDKDIILPAPIPYRNYILWRQQQNELKAETYWRKNLQNFTTPTPLGMEIRRQDNEGVVRKEYTLNNSVSNQLQNLARQHHITLNTIIQGAWALLLSRYSGETDIVFGTTVSGRPPELANVNDIIGLFINTLPVRVKVDERSELIPWLEQLQAQQVEREQYSYTGLVEIQGWSDVERGTPLFSSLVVFENYPVSVKSIIKSIDSNLEVDDAQGYDVTNYPLTLTVIPGNEILFKIDYSRTRFDEQFVEGLFRYLQALLEGMVGGLRVWELESPQPPGIRGTKNNGLASPLLRGTEGDFFYQLFEAQVTQTPDSIALVAGDECFTYAQLNELVNQFAWYLQDLGVRAETPVGICVERGKEMVIGILAILKAGGAYVPLDPNPQSRLAWVLDDAQVKILITQTHILKQLPQLSQTQVICIDQNWHIISQYPTTNPAITISPQNLAYIIYTSGSTGMPKGVMIQHSGLVDAYLAWEQVYQLRAFKICHLQMASFAFDVFTQDVIRTLLSGGTLVLSPKNLVLEPDKLYEFMLQHHINSVEFVPAALRNFMQYLDNSQQRLDFLELIICGADSWYMWEYRKLRQLCGSNTRVFNSYGLTEATIDNCYFIDDGTVEDEKLVPIGYSFSNTQVYILDDYLHSAPVGVVGEIYIGGSCLARGYLNRPDLTAQRFIPTPNSSLLTPNLIYKTGDLGRFLPNGAVEFLGRSDNQVKIRGFRIELGEVEGVIGQYPGVHECAVVLAGDSDKFLVAYVSSVSVIGDKDLHEFVAGRLPGYMVPSGFVYLPALPRNPNGKIDRRALPLYEKAPIINIAAPRTPTEELLVNIWKTVLNIDSVGVDDNFFALGGHSLLVTRVVSEVKSVFGVEVSLRQVFENPTISDLAAIITSSHQTSEIIIPRITKRASIPLSFAQQRLWFLAQLEPESTAYNVTAALRLDGNLNIEVLKQCFAEVVRRHEILRTSFVTVDGQPVTETSPPTPLLQGEGSMNNFSPPSLLGKGVGGLGSNPAHIDIPLIDLSSVSSSQQEIIVEQLTQNISQLTFDLKECPLFGVRLLYIEQNKYILLLTMHHIITDGWSVDVLATELTTLYKAFSQGLSSPLPNLSIQYADFAAWQRELLQDNKFQHQLDFWRQQLDNVPILELPTDYQRTSVQSGKGRRHNFNIPLPVTQAIQQLGKQTNTTLFMVMYSALSVLLHRYSQQDDIVIGSPIANRHYPGTESVIGFFVNTLALRINLANNPSAEELLPRVREMVLAAYAHQDVPFEQVVEALQPTRVLSHSPLFQVMLVVENASKSIELDGLSWSPLELDNGTAKFDLTLMVSKTGAGLQCKWEYNSDLFTEATIAKFTQHFQTVLERITSQPTQKISNLPLISETEFQQVINFGSSQSYEYQDCIHKLFEQQVEKSGDAIAVEIPPTPLSKGGFNSPLIPPLLRGARGDSNVLSYKELNNKANQVAHYLKSLGVRQEVPIAICVEDKQNFLIGILGILKAGGFYVPLDVNNPTERLVLIMKDTQAQILLTEESLRDKIPASVTICFDTDREIISQQPIINLESETTTENLAYVMYTSGSTGLPKGVCIPHRGVVRLVKNCDYVELNDKQIILQAAPLIFDASTFEIWAALLNGACLVIVPSQQPSLTELANIITQYQITTLWLTAGLFNLMVDEQLPNFTSVKQVLAGGDVLSATHVQKLVEAYPQCRVINGYGPTENTTFTCCYSYSSDLKNIPIGRAISNTQVYILDRYLNPVPIGVPGELYIAGDGIARGYLNNPDLTAEKFIPNPYSALSTQHSTLYKTGDRVRYLPDGNIEYLGRLDNQVKIRGFRIELGEIETAIKQHPEIQDCVVVVHETQHKQLVAYYVSTPPLVPPLSRGDKLRPFLQQHLPDYLIPSFFIPLPSFPLTSNGKVDKKALPAPELPAQQDIILPRTEIEATLANIWSSLLNLPQVSIHDNFFELGGDSILAIQIISRAHQAGLQLNPKQLFQYQTIAELATVITPAVYTVQQSVVTGTAPFTPIQHWFFEQDLPEPSHFNQAVFLEVEKIQVGILKLVFQQLLQHHDALRSQFTSTHFEIAAPDDNIPLISCDLSSLAATQQQKAISEISNQVQASLDITNCLLRIVHFDLGNVSRLLVVIHHLVIDGVSWRILLEDLQTAYQQAVEGKVITLPPKTTSFITWTEHLYNYAASSSVLKEVDYWLSEHYSAVQPLPVNNKDGSNIVADADSVIVNLSVEETQALLQQVPSVYNTQINDVLLTAVADAVSTWTGQNLLSLNLESYGRAFPEAEIDVSRTVGWFTVMFPLVLRVESGDWGDKLKSIKEQLRAVPNFGFNYGLLRYINQSLKNLSFPEISFNYLGQLDISGDSEFTYLPLPGATQSKQQPRSALIEINGFVRSGQLQFEWIYSNKQYHKSTITTLAHNFCSYLEEIIIHCQSSDGGYTPSDFTLANLDNNTLDLVLGMVNFDTEDNI